MFSLFSFIKSKNSFEGELPGEKVIFITRKHWFFFFLPLLIFFFFFLLPFLLYLWLRKFEWFSSFSSLFWFLVSLYFLFLWISLFYALMRYILTVTIVTNQRVIKIETKGFFNYERAETELKRIQDVAFKIYGIFGTFLNFGNLEIQTAGTEVKFTFPQLPNPEKIKEIVIREMKKI